MNKTIERQHEYSNTAAKLWCHKEFLLCHNTKGASLSNKTFPEADKTDEGSLFNNDFSVLNKQQSLPMFKEQRSIKRNH